MDRVEKHIIIKITNRGVFYNENEFIEWENTNFPSKDEFNFNERGGIFWEAKLISYDSENSQLNVDIVNYEVDHKREIFNNQKARFPFKKIWFNKLKWLELIKILNVYKQILFDEISDSSNPRRGSEIRNEKLVDFSEGTTKIVKIDIDFKYPLIKSKFKMGYVEIEKTFEGFSTKFKIKLENDNIIPEFDHVKPFFAKALGSKKIEVTGYLEISDMGEIKVKCQSKEINQINEDLITAVRRLTLKDLIFKPEIKVIDKSLFTPEEYFEGIEEERLGNILNKSDKDIVEEIIQLEGVRNRKQLLYLSGKLQSKRMGLRFTLSPEFGFLFCVEGERMDHFIWELLNSHATYIWSLDKEGVSLEKKLKLIEREVNIIRENGRRKYLKINNPVDLVFNKINHEKSKTGVVDGFPKWKMRVNEKIV